MQAQPKFDYGRPVNILEYSTISGSWKFDVDALESVLLRRPIANKPVCVISVVGRKRIGKSMLLNYCLRYLSSTKNTTNWMGADNNPLYGFESNSGDNCVTHGIWIWSRPFLKTLPNGREVAIVLMDCEGLYGDGRDSNISSRIFGISTAISSVQIFNVQENLSSDDLQNLNLFVSLGEMGLGSKVVGQEGSRPFQKLIFLVRSWRFPQKKSFGYSQEYLDEKLRNISNVDCDSIKETKRSIINAFEDINCYLMPHPGSDKIYADEFHGELTAFDKKFKTHLKQFIESVLTPETLIQKKVFGKTAICSDICEIFERIRNQSNSKSYPEIPSIRMATILSFKTVVLNQLEDEYTRELRTEVYRCRLLTPSRIAAVHNDLKERLLNKFNDMDKVLTVCEAITTRNELSQVFDANFSSFLNEYDVYVHRTRSELLSSSAKAASVGFIGFGVKLASPILIEVLATYIDSDVVSLFSPVITIGTAIGALYSGYNFWKWFDSKELNSLLETLKISFRRKSS